MHSNMSDVFSPAPGWFVVKSTAASTSLLEVPVTPSTVIRTGVVVAVGPSYVHDSGVIIPSPVVEGDELLHAYFGHQDFEYDGEPFRMVHFRDFLNKFPKGLK